MTVGVRVGPAVGVRVGPAVGPNIDGATTALPGVTFDAQGGKYAPASAAEWATVLAISGVTSGGPSALWLLQDASGNAADSIGAFTLTASGAAATYATTVTGWSRKALTFTDASTTGFVNNAAGLPDVLTTSASVLLYSQITNPGAFRARMALGVGGTYIGDTITPTGVESLRVTGDGNSDGTSNSTGVVRPTWLTINRTASSETLVTDQDKISLAFSALPSGKGITLGSSSASAGATNNLYACMFFGAAAELTTTQQKRVLQVLGWSIPWS